ncbi:PadR family transcriptional regulator [Furfurilactobacillus cerevisiae]|uniref:PadR family transcriptional regulator n=1 Tax=Furfurilactobacillus rossiae TaxID=231049 RepID=UPI003B97D10F
MKSRQIVLGILKSGPQTGYDITQLFQTSFAFFFDSSAGMVYPALRKLEKDGLVTKEIVPQQGKPDKHVYTITDAGSQEFEDYLKSPVEPESVKSDFLARLMFGEFVDPKHIVQIVKDEIAKETEEAEQLQQRLKNYLPTYNKTMSTGQKLAFAYGINSSKTEIAFLQQWLDEHPDGK